MEKIITFIKVKLIELSGVVTIFSGLAYFISLTTYSANSISYVFPSEKNIHNKFFSFFYYLSDFFLQAFGILAFLIFLNLIIWGGYLIIKKKIENFSVKLLFLILSIIFGALFFSINIDQSFWLPDNGFGGFVANFISEKLKMQKHQKLGEKNQKDNKKKRKIYYEYFFLRGIYSLYYWLSRLLKRQNTQDQKK